MTIATNILLASIPFLVNFYANRFQEHDKEYAFDEAPSDLGLPREERYDFIVVGAGAAGCVIAKRLADENFTVLLVEAGGPPPPLLDVPLLSKYTTNLSKIHYLFESTPQKYAGFDGYRVIKTPAGKMLGGSTSETEMIFERGSPIDYDDWADITGDPSWKHENILKFFLKTEKEMKGNHTGEHSYESAAIEDKDVWIQAGKELGFAIRNATGPEAVGFSYTKFLNPAGRRVNAYHAYLQNNYTQILTIRPFSVVTQVLMENKRAVGVQYERHGVPRLAFAYNEVILCAGTYLSPVILMNSGIGPAEQLREAKIEPISILPVGENLMDHVMVDVGPFYVNPEHAWSLRDNLTFADISAFEGQGDGPLSASLVYGQSVASLASSRATGMERRPYWPDVQVYYQNLEDDSLTVKCVVVLARPHSRGRLTLNPQVSRAVDDPASILLGFQYLSDPGDVDVMIEGVNFCLNTIENTKAFEQLGAKFTAVPYQGCNHLAFRSKEYWDCYVRATAVSAYHAAGTCRMGKSDDPQAVVDSELKVRGVQGLRVVDASVMPFITGAGPDEPTMMIAEKLAEQLLQLYEDGANKSSRSTASPVPLESSLKGSRTLAFEGPYGNQWPQHAIGQQGEASVSAPFNTPGQNLQPNALPRQADFPPYIRPLQNVAPLPSNTMQGTPRPTTPWPGGQYPSQVPQLQTVFSQSNGPQGSFGTSPGVPPVPFPQNSPLQANMQSYFARNRFRTTNGNGIAPDQIARGRTWDRRGTYSAGGSPSGYRPPGYQQGLAPQALPAGAPLWQGFQGGLTQQPWKVVQDNNGGYVPGRQAQFSPTGTNKVFLPPSSPLYQQSGNPLSGQQMQLGMFNPPTRGADRDYAYDQRQPGWQSRPQNELLPFGPTQPSQQQGPMQQQVPLPQQQAPVPQQQEPRPQLQEPLPQQQALSLPQQQLLYSKQVPSTPNQATQQQDNLQQPQVPSQPQQIYQPLSQLSFLPQEQGPVSQLQGSLPKQQLRLPKTLPTIPVLQPVEPTSPGIQRLQPLNQSVSPPEKQILPVQQPLLLEKVKLVVHLAEKPQSLPEPRPPSPNTSQVMVEEQQTKREHQQPFSQNEGTTQGEMIQETLPKNFSSGEQVISQLNVRATKTAQSASNGETLSTGQPPSGSQSRQGLISQQQETLYPEKPSPTVVSPVVPQSEISDAQQGLTAKHLELPSKQNLFASKSQPLNSKEQQPLLPAGELKLPLILTEKLSSDAEHPFAADRLASTTDQSFVVVRQTSSSTEQPTALIEQPEATTEWTSSPANLPSTPTERTSLPANQPSKPTEQTSSPANLPSTPTERTSLPTNQPSTPTEQTSSPANQPSTPTEQTSSSANQPSTPTEQTSSPANQSSTPTEQTSSSANQPSTPTEQPSVRKEKLPSITDVPPPYIEPTALLKEEMPLLVETSYPSTKQQQPSFAEKELPDAVTEGLQSLPANVSLSSIPGLSVTQSQSQVLVANVSNANSQDPNPETSTQQQPSQTNDIQASNYYLQNKTIERRVPEETFVVVTQEGTHLQLLPTTSDIESSATTANPSRLTGLQDGLLFAEQHVTQLPKIRDFSREETSLPQQQTTVDSLVDKQFVEQTIEATLISEIGSVEETTLRSIWTTEQNSAPLITDKIHPDQKVLPKGNTNFGSPENTTANGESALAADTQAKNERFNESDGQAGIKQLNLEVVVPSKHFASEAVMTESYVSAVPETLDTSNFSGTRATTEDISTSAVLEHHLVSVVTPQPLIVSSHPLLATTLSNTQQMHAIHPPSTQNESIHGGQLTARETTTSKIGLENKDS